MEIVWAVCTYTSSCLFPSPVLLTQLAVVFLHIFCVSIALLPRPLTFIPIDPSLSSPLVSASFFSPNLSLWQPDSGPMSSSPCRVQLLTTFGTQSNPLTSRLYPLPQILFHNLILFNLITFSCYSSCLSHHCTILAASCTVLVASFIVGYV